MPTEPSDFQQRRRCLRDNLRRISFDPIMRGSLVHTRRRCGKAGCACAADPAARHPGTYLSVHLQGRTQILYVRPEDEQDIQRALDGYQRLWQIIDGLTACEFAELKRKARERSRSRKRRRQ